MIEISIDVGLGFPIRLLLLLSGLANFCVERNINLLMHRLFDPSIPVIICMFVSVVVARLI